MELSPRFLVLVGFNILFNLYTLGLLNHSYSIKSSSANCDCQKDPTAAARAHALASMLSTAAPLPSPAIRGKSASERDAEVEREVELAAQQNPSIPSPQGHVTGEKSGRVQTVREFVVMIPSARRPAGAFYLEQCVEALLASHVPAEAITVMNMDRDDNPNLYGFFRELKKRGERVELMERNYVKPKKELKVDDLREFGFYVKPEEMKSEGYEVAVKDNLERKVWRSKEAIDFVVLARKMLLGHPETEWFVFLQDDAVLHKTIKDLYATLRKLVNAHPSVAVFHLNKWGNVALMFHRHFLESFMAYSNLRFDLMPIDWLLSHHKRTIGSKERVLNIFSHVGLKSSFVQNDRSTLIN